MFNSIAMTRRKYKNACNIVCWGYFLIRTYHHYGKPYHSQARHVSNISIGYIGLDLTAGTVFLVFCGD
jgi:hypothetical protein